MKRVLFASLLTLVACEMVGPLDRTNPYDSGSPYPMSLINVPDAVYSIGERFTAEIFRDPPLPDDDYVLTWESIDPSNGFPSLILQSTFGGEYLLTALASADYRTISIGARFNSSIVVGRNVVVGQRTATLDLACELGDCASLAPTPASTIAVTSASADARGNPVRALNVAMARAVVTSRNPAAIVPAYTPNTTGTYHFTAVAPGSAWLVIRMDLAVDSVFVTVVP